VTKTQGYWASPVRPWPPGSENNDKGIPGPFEGIREATPPYRFKWTDMVESLRQRADNDEPDPTTGTASRT